MDLKQADVLALQTKSMQEDLTVQGFSAALTPQVRAIAEDIMRIMIYARIDELPEELLDILAWQYSALWYDVDSPIDVKREAIREVFMIHKTKGTPAAVQRVVELFFGDGRVEEWFEYEGEPGYFRITTNNPEATTEKAALLAKAVSAVKRFSAHLESVVIIGSEEINLNFAGVLHMSDKLTMEQVV